MAGERHDRVQHLGVQSGDGRDGAWAAPPAVGQTADEPTREATDQWAITVAPYLWATAMDGNATVGGIKSDVDVPFSDILKDLSFGAMMLVDVAKGPLGIGVNGLFARVSPDSDVGGIKIDTTSDTVQLGVAPYYRVIDWAYRTSPSGRPLRLWVAPEAGFRFTYLRAELEVRGGRTFDQSESWVDPLVGSRFGLDLTDRFALATEANVGGFGVGSDFAWNAQAFLNYKTSLFGLATTFAIGYRALLSGLPPQRFQVGRDHARAGPRHRGALLSASRPPEGATPLHHRRYGAGCPDQPRGGSYAWSIGSLAGCGCS